MNYNTALEIFYAAMWYHLRDIHITPEIKIKLIEIFEKTFELQKEQIMQSYNDGKYAVIDLSKNKSLESYYKEKYSK